MKTVRFKKLRKTAKTPTRGSSCAAGFDLYADISEDQSESVRIDPHITKRIGTGIAIENPDGYFGAIFARSGLATKCGLRPANCVGVIDSDYRGEIIVALHNDSDTPRFISAGDRIAQIVFIPYAVVQFVESDELSRTDRDVGGFGSTGT